MKESHEQKVQVYREKAKEISEDLSYRDNRIKELQQRVSGAGVFRSTSICRPVGLSACVPVCLPAFLPACLNGTMVLLCKYALQDIRRY